MALLASAESVLLWNLAFNRVTLLYIVLPCMAAVVSRPAWRMLVLLIAQYVINLINEHYY